MRNATARPTYLFGAAMGAALVWGTLELVALQWSRMVERFGRSGR
ncbi:MAG: hypothetical protein P4L36_03580 [Holophaga sp.]|nr:hypothetical protein [Holophaga sp.]